MGGIISSGRPILPLEVDETKLYVPIRNHHPWERGGPYSPVYKIGEGAFSECRVAIKKHGTKKVVIKHIHSDYVLPNYKSQINYEFNILSQLSHPSILCLEEVFTCYKDYFMVTEYLGGGELFDAICDKEIYLEEDIRGIMLSVVDALKYCHSRNVVHRDIKPENLILVNKASYSSVKIIDFGFSRVVRNEKDLPHDLRGTPYYLAPEVIKQVPYSKPVDIWSMGCIFHLLLVGVLPFESHDIDKLYKLIQNGHLVFQNSHWQNVSGTAMDLVMKMMELDPNKRITSLEILQHPWMKEETNRDNSKSLGQLKVWQTNRKLRGTALVVQSSLAFKKSGQKFRRSLIKAAQQVKELEADGIDWKDASSHASHNTDPFYSHMTYSASLSEHNN